MSTNLIKNYIDFSKANPDKFALMQQKEKDRANFFTLQEQNTMKPLAGRGRLLHSSLFSLPTDTVNDIGYDLKSLRSGLSGDSNDHQLGKLNDIGMKLGGLGIASYLFTKKVAPTAKYMEFIGLGSFFASMALWPKLALQAPAKLIHGFNIQQKYEDSMGRKKLVFSDPQYIPWDLYSDEEISKIGDRLHVSKDIPNRREFVQEKMKKIALQNNTMWMLTAGFATPIMSALICNLSEKHITKLLDKINNASADHMMSNMADYTGKYENKELKKAFDSILTANKDKPIDEKLMEQIVESMHIVPDNTVTNAVKRDLKTLFINPETQGMVNEQLIRETLEKFPKTSSMRYYREKQKEVQANMPCVNEVIEALKAKNLYNRPLMTHQEATDAKIIIQRTISAKMVKAKIVHPKDSTGRLLVAKLMEMKLAPADILDEAKIKKLQAIYATLEKQACKFAAQTDYYIQKFGDKSETLIVNRWNDVTQDIPDILGISGKKAELASKKPGLMDNIVRGRLEQITSDDKEYERVINALSKKAQVIEERINKELQDAYIALVKETTRDSSVELAKLGLEEASDSMIGVAEKKHEIRRLLSEIDGDAKKAEGIRKMFTDEWKTSEAEIRKAMTIIDKANSETDSKLIQEALELIKKVGPETYGHLEATRIKVLKQRVADVKNVFYRLINTMDLYRRISKGNLGAALPDNLPIEIKEELIECAKTLMLKGHNVDYSLKLPFHRNLNPNPATGKVNIVKGIVQNQFYKPGSENNVLIGYHSDFFKRTMRFSFASETTDNAVYSHQMDAITEKALSEAGILDRMHTYQKDCFLKLGGAPNPLNGNNTFDHGQYKNLRSYNSSLAEGVEGLLNSANVEDSGSELGKALHEHFKTLKSKFESSMNAINDDASLTDEIKEARRKSLREEGFAKVVEKLTSIFEYSYDDKNPENKIKLQDKDKIFGFKTIEEIKQFISEKGNLAKLYDDMLKALPEEAAVSTLRENFALTSCAPETFIRKLVQNSSNTKKWLKMFGGFGAGLLGVTVLSQFFFGKINQPIPETRKVNKG